MDPIIRVKPEDSNLEVILFCSGSIRQYLKELFQSLELLEFGGGESIGIKWIDLRITKKIFTCGVIGAFENRNMQYYIYLNWKRSLKSFKIYRKMLFSPKLRSYYIFN